MTSMKRFGLAALLVVGVALCTNTPAQAQYTIDLTPTAAVSDPDYGASGQATWTSDGGGFVFTWLRDDRYYSPIQVRTSTGQVTVTYEGLTPGATYQIKATSWQTALASNNKERNASYSYSQFTASTNGIGQATVPASFSEKWVWIVYDPRYPEYGGYYSQIEEGYIYFSVARKANGKYTPVLSGHFSGL
jgi:hypothetical protein